MATASMQLTSQIFEIKGSFREGLLVLTGACITEAISRIPEIRLEFITQDTSFRQTDILGTQMTVLLKERTQFTGVCISVEHLGQASGYIRYVAEIRPWLWFLTLQSENRIFQNLSTPDILKRVFEESGFTDVDMRLSDGYDPRVYCVQYDETHFDFVSRLMEEEGICYFFESDENDVEVLVLSDDVAANTLDNPVEFKNRVERSRREFDTVFEWSQRSAVVPGKVSLFDYNMLVPNARLGVTSAILSGIHPHKRYEHYHAHGHYEAAIDGENQARNQIEHHANRSEGVDGASTAPFIRAGWAMSLKYPDRPDQDGRYLITAVTHYLRLEKEQKTDTMREMPEAEAIRFPEDMVVYQNSFEVIRDSIPYRPARVTPWPHMPGLTTATVTGPAGDEIHTDAHGRIKVQFHWDRQGKKDEKTTCWVRSVIPWTGKDWGMQSIPRIGMEVVIQFERGNPDRPYCTGMIYNGVNKPPYPLPAEMTKTGIRTNSSKGGNGFHELTFDDKKGSELVFLQSERDYKEIIKNNAVITVGMEHKDKGDLTQTVYRHKTETLKTGNHTFTVESGNEVMKVSGNQNEDIGGNRVANIGGSAELSVGGTLTETIGGNVSQTYCDNREVIIGTDSEHTIEGNHTFTVRGNTTRTVGGNDLETVGGNRTEDVGKSLKIEAGREILLKVDGSTITITKNKIAIKADEVTIDGKKITITSATLMTIAGKMTDVKADGILTLKGSLAKIN